MQSNGHLQWLDVVQLMYLIDKCNQAWIISLGNHNLPRLDLLLQTFALPVHNFSKKLDYHIAIVWTQFLFNHFPTIQSTAYLFPAVNLREFYNRPIHI